MKERRDFFFNFHLTVITLSSHLFFHWHWNLLLWEPTHTEDQLRHPPQVHQVIEVLLDSWMFHLQLAIVGVQPVSHSHKFMYMYLWEREKERDLFIYKLCDSVEPQLMQVVYQHLGGSIMYYDSSSSWNPGWLQGRLCEWL